jgi:hypothetical protein
MDHWDVLLMGGSAYVAMISLIRLMAKRRNQLIQQFHREIEQQRSAPPPAAAKSGAGEPDAGAAEREVA